MAELDELIADVLTAGENIIRSSSAPLTRNGVGFVEIGIKEWGAFLHAMQFINDACPDAEDDPCLNELVAALPTSKSVQYPTLSHRQFVLAGKAVFNLEFLCDAKSITFRVNKHDSKPLWFVNIGHGYGESIYLGMIDESLNFKLTAKSPSDQSYSYRLFDQFWLHAKHKGEAPNSIKFTTAGRCCVCYRELTNPESIAAGIGPECSGREF